MIAEILDRRFIIAELRRLDGDLIARRVERSVRGAGDPNAEVLIDAVHEGLAAAERAELEALAAAREERRDVRGAVDVDGPLLEEHVAYLPRDPFLSATQSALEEFYVEARPDLVEGLPRPDERRLRGEVELRDPPMVTAQRLRLAQPGPSRVRLFEKFSMTDPRWVQSKLSEWFTHWNHKHRFREGNPAPAVLADDARVVIVADWGSGIPRAQRVATQMRRAVEQSLQRRQDVHVVHLGDTYYSGWRKEYLRNFLPYWPVWPEEARTARSWALNGNHEMYSGGDGYYELLEDPRFAGHDNLSFFHLRNAYWDVLGLDTAYKDHDLAGDQAAWVERALTGSPRKSMLLSHHQPFSGRNDKGAELRATLARVLSSGVDAWLWGHEHRHTEYEPHAGVRNGRLIGHGGVPVWMWRTASSASPLPECWEYRDRLSGFPDAPWAMLGFAILDFNGPSIDVKYVNELGATYRTETIG